jgi:serine/threonine-protein kinase
MASGLLKGGFSFFGKKGQTETKVVTESTTETETETQKKTETETETKLAFMTMPNLIDYTEKEAKDLLKDIEIELVVEEGKSDYYDTGRIFQQYPDAGTTIGSGDTVTIYVCTGAESFELPDVTDMDYNQASDKLRNLGLSVYLEFENSDTINKDHVIRTDPESGSSVTEGTTITIYASEGKEIKTSTVPDLRGYDLESAIALIEEAGLVYNGKSSDYSDTYDAETVMDQSLSAGTTVNEGTTITLVMSLGPRVHTYNATVYVSTPFAGKIVDDEGKPVSEGRLTIEIVQDGESVTIYDQNVTSATMPSSVECTSNSNSEAVAEFYLGGVQYDTASVSFY